MTDDTRADGPEHRRWAEGRTVPQDPEDGLRPASDALLGGVAGSGSFAPIDDAPSLAALTRPPGIPDQIGPYRVLDEIGRGGMGIVYRGTHEGLRRSVALKVLIAGEDASPTAIERFRREAEAVARIGHHPHIVPIYDFGQQGNLHYVAMQLIDGRSLDRLVEDGEVAPRRAAVLARKVALGLAFAHEHGIFHRDIKPANVLVGADGEPKITDFGLAKDIESGGGLTRSGVLMGSPPYMPPEQALGEFDRVDARSDVYALGATLYHLLVGEPPFDGDAMVAVIRQVLSDPPRPPRRRNPAVERDLESICMKCLEKEPARRYPTAAAAAADLERYLAGRPVEAKPVTGLRRAAMWVRRNRALATTSVLAVVGAVALLGVALWSLWLADRVRVARVDALEVRARDAAIAEEARFAALLAGADVELAASVLVEARRDGVLERLAAAIETSDAAGEEAVARGLAAYDPGRVLSHAHYLRGEWTLAYRHDPAGPWAARAQIELAARLHDRRRYGDAERHLRSVITRRHALGLDRADARRALEVLSEVLTESGRLDEAGGALAEAKGLGGASDANDLRDLLAAIGATRQVVELPPRLRGGRVRRAIVLELDPPVVVVPWCTGRAAWQVTDGRLESIRSPLAELPSGDDIHDAAAADFDGDGAPEILAFVHRRGTGSGFVVFERDVDDGRFRIAQAELGNQAPPKAMGVGDLNGDGRPEALLSFEWRSPAQWIVGWAGDGLARSTPFVPPGSRPWLDAPTIGDVDGDGRPELVIGRDITTNGRLEVYRIAPGADGTRIDLAASRVIGRANGIRLLGAGRIAVACDVEPTFLDPRQTDLPKDTEDGIVVLRLDADGLHEESRQPTSFGDAGDSRIGGLDVGRLAGRPALLAVSDRSRRDPDQEAAEGRRLCFVVGDPTGAPTRVGWRDRIDAARLLDLDGDGASELLLVGPERLTVRAARTEPWPAIATAGEETAASEEETLFAAVADLIGFEDFAAARALLDDIGRRFPGAAGARRSRWLSIECHLREADDELEWVRAELVARRPVEAERRHGRAMERFEIAAEAARREAKAAAAAGEASLARRLHELEAAARRELLDWPGLYGATRKARAAAPSVSDGRIRPLKLLARLGEGAPRLEGDLADPAHPFVADLPVRTRRDADALVVTIDGRSVRHVAGVPVTYVEGPFEIEADVGVAFSGWLINVDVGLVPVDDVARPPREGEPGNTHLTGPVHPGAVGIRLHSIEPWSERGALFTLHGRPGEGWGRIDARRFRGRWRMRLTYAPAAGISALELRSLIDPDLVYRTRGVAPALAPGRYVLGITGRHRDESAGLAHAKHPGRTELRIANVVFRSPTAWVTDAPATTARELARLAGGHLVRGRVDAAAALYRRALAIDAAEHVARVHLPLCGGTADELAAGFASDPYGFVMTLDDAYRGAPAAAIRSVGVLLREIAASRPRLRPACLLLLGEFEAAAPGLARASDPASRYLRRRYLIAAAGESDAAFFARQGLRGPGQQLPQVFWDATPVELPDLSALLARPPDARERLRAWVAFSRRLIARPDDRAALAGRAQLALAMGRLGRSHEDLRRRAELAPADGAGWIDLANLLLSAYDAIDEAIECLERIERPARAALANPAFDPLREDARFRAIEARAR